MMITIYHFFSQILLKFKVDSWEESRSSLQKTGVCCACLTTTILPNKVNWRRCRNALPPTLENLLWISLPLRAFPFYFPRDITSFPHPRASALANYLVRYSALIHSHFANSIFLGARDAARPLRVSSRVSTEGRRNRRASQP